MNDSPNKFPHPKIVLKVVLSINEMPHASYLGQHLSLIRRHKLLSFFLLHWQVKLLELIPTMQVQNLSYLSLIITCISIVEVDFACI